MAKRCWIRRCNMAFPNMNTYYRIRYTSINFRYHTMYNRRRYAYKQSTQDRCQDIWCINMRYIMKTQHPRMKNIIEQIKFGATVNIIRPGEKPVTYLSLLFVGPKEDLR